MENAPLGAESGSDKKESKKKKKSAEHLGAMLVEPEAKPDDKPKKSKEKAPEAEHEAVETKEADAPLDELDQEESAEVVARLVEAERGAESTAEAEDPAVLAAIESFRNKLVENGKDIDEAYQETLDELATEPIEEAPVGAEGSDEPMEFGDDETEIVLTHEDAVDPFAEQPAESDDGSQPPRPPAPPTARSGPSPEPGRPRPSRTGNRSLDRLAPRAYEQVPVYGDTAFLSVASTEGVIGYLIGRRRGRIKTEKKLLPVQKKLERRVGELQQDIAYKESRIRRIARQKDRAERQVLIEQSRQAKPARREAEAAFPSTSLNERQTKTEKDHSIERIGHVILGGEAPAAPGKAEVRPTDKKPERPSRQTKQQEKLRIEKRVDTMNRTELLDISDKIHIEGSSLRQIYETHLVGEKGLRRLVNEFMRGGDIKKQLRREIVEREIDFERDPVLRDKAMSAAQGGGSATNLQNLLKQAGAALPAESEEAAFYRARAAFEADERVRQQSRQRLMDVSMVTVIAVLAAAVAMLVFTR